MRNRITILLGIISLGLFASWVHPDGEELPGTFITRTGNIALISEAPLEIIQANSPKLYGIVDLINKKFAFSVHVTSFEGFKSSLQRDHFREKFLESGRFPKATFQGKLITSELFNKPGTYAVRAKGTLDIHGVKKERIVNGTINLTREGIILDAALKIPLIDHDITIPTIVNQKIAKEIQITIQADMKKEKKKKP